MPGQSDHVIINNASGPIVNVRNTPAVIDPASKWEPAQLTFKATTLDVSYKSTIGGTLMVDGARRRRY